MIECSSELVEKYLSGISTVVLSNEYGIHYSTIRNILLKNGIKLRSNKENSRKYTVDHNAFSDILSESQAYWLGFLFADGYVSSVNGKRVGLSLKRDDREHIEKFRVFLKSDYPICDYVSSGYTNTNYSRIVISSDQLYDNLVSYGVKEHKSNILTFPTYMTDELTRHFIRGYVDGDGCITSNGNSYCLKIMGTIEFLNGVKDYLISQDVYKRCRFEKRKEECVVQSMNMFGETAYHTISLLYNNSTIYLDRKHILAQKALEYFSRLYR